MPCYISYPLFLDAKKKHNHPVKTGLDHTEKPHQSGENLVLLTFLQDFFVEAKFFQTLFDTVSLSWIWEKNVLKVCRIFLESISYDNS